MRQQAFVHIGTHKTGTTTLQAWFDGNREVLRDRGLSYPRAYSVQGAHHLLAGVVTDAKIGVRQIYPQFDFAQSAPSIHQRILADVAPGTDLVLSSETFCLYRTPRDVQALHAVLESFERNVVVYLRPLLGQLESGHGQFVKTYRHQESSSLEQLFTEKVLRRKPALGDRLGMVDRWGGTFGPKRLLARPFLRDALVGKTITQDFLETIGHGELDAGATEFAGRAPEQTNVSPSPFWIEVIRRLSAENAFREVSRQRWRDILTDVVTVPDAPQPDVKFYTRRFAQHVMATAGRHEAAIAERFFPEVAGHFTQIPEATFLDDLSSSDRSDLEATVCEYVEWARERYRLASA